ncbi:MAG: arginyl-tRNA synthetase [candidate division TM6 bacterium GW2011_GWF2_32_72]|nr:MAG: arginyl-tRNA synthetase [candidate division TM6 bacterium GW2011_GWF2_32_72]
MNLLEYMQNSLFSFLKNQFKIENPEKNINLTLNTDKPQAQFGDLSTNAAMVLAKELQKNPREIAQEISKNFINKFIEKTEIAGPGFINFFLTKEAFQELSTELFEQDKNFFKSENLNKTNYSIEFVSANPTGPLHLGHGRGGIIGDVLGNILKFLGYDVTKEFYINDAGVQINKLGESFKARCLQALGIPAELPEGGYQGEYLQELAEELVNEKGDDLKKESADFFKNYAKDHLLNKIKETLSEYGIHYDVWFSEKSLHESGAIDAAVKDLVKKGHTYEQDGAIWFKSTEFQDDKDRVLKKATGEYTYVSPDIAYMKNKIDRGAQKMIMILGQDHHSYVNRLKGLLEAMGYNPDMLTVILYQLVSMKSNGEAVRMSKRAGNIVTLQDVTATVGKDVARFFYLNRKADAHLDFDLDLALKKTDENPVYYIQYAFVRTKSILEKANQSPELQNICSDDAKNIGQEEYGLIKKIISLKHLLEVIGENFQTHLLTYYTIELAQTFHSYYNQNKVIDLENITKSRARLLMIHDVKNSLELCLKLMGLNTPEKM